MLDKNSSLGALRADFLATSTQSMPIAGIIFWAAVAASGLMLPARTVAFIVGFGSGAIFPFAVLIDKIRGRTLIRSDTSNPVLGMFLQSLATVALLWPFVLIAAFRASDPTLVVLGGAILMGIVWIPYGWARGRSIGTAPRGSEIGLVLRGVPHRAGAIRFDGDRLRGAAVLRVLTRQDAPPAPVYAAPHGAQNRR